LPANATLDPLATRRLLHRCALTNIAFEAARFVVD
jgi:hypothetical protein